MWLRRIFFLLLLTVLLLLFIYTGAYYLLVLFVTLISIMIISLFSMLFFKWKSNIVFEKDKIEYHGLSFFPVGKVKVKYEIKNMFLETSQVQSVSFIIPTKKIQIPLDIKDQIGRLSLQIKKCVLTDMLSLFKCSLKCEPKHEILLNSVNQQDETISMNIVENIFSRSKCDDYEIREYHRGDSLKDIHYKISYKMKKYMVKDTTKSRMNRFSIFLELSGNESECLHVLQSFWNVSQYLISQQEVFDVLWMSQYDLKTERIDNIVLLEKVLDEILSHPKAYESKIPLEADMFIKASGIEEA